MILHMCFHCILVFLNACKEGRASGINFRQSFSYFEQVQVPLAVGIVAATGEGGVQLFTFGSAVMFVKPWVQIFLESTNWHKHNCCSNGRC